MIASHGSVLMLALQAFEAQAFPLVSVRPVAFVTLACLTCMVGRADVSRIRPWVLQLPHGTRTHQDVLLNIFDVREATDMAVVHHM